MNDFLNHYSGLLSILAIVLSIPTGILSTLVSPKVKAWLAFRSTKRRLNRIQVLEAQIAEIESLKSKPVLVITKFVNLSHKGLTRQIVLVVLFILMTAFIISISYFSRPESMFSQYLNAPMPPISTFGLVLWILALFFLSVGLVVFVSVPTLQLQELTYRVENFTKWKQQVMKEIEELRTNAKG